MRDAVRDKIIYYFFNDLVCQPLVTSYVIDAYLCLVMLHAWTLEHQYVMICI